MDPSRSISSFSNILREADSALSAMGSPGPQNAQICIRFRKSESARAVVVGVQTATSESPKVLGLLLWVFKRPRPKVRKCSGCCCGRSNGHVRKSESAPLLALSDIRPGADSGVQIFIISDSDLALSALSG